jgi:hypothetical protein
MKFGRCSTLTYNFCRILIPHFPSPPCCYSCFFSASIFFFNDPTLPIATTTALTSLFIFIFILERRLFFSLHSCRTFGSNCNFLMTVHRTGKLLKIQSKEIFDSFYGLKCCKSTYFLYAFSKFLIKKMRSLV